MRVYERPSNLFVAGFIGSPAMNFLRGRIVHQDGLQLELGFARVHLANSGGTGGGLGPPGGAPGVAGPPPPDLRPAPGGRAPAREPRPPAGRAPLAPGG